MYVTLRGPFPNTGGSQVPFFDYAFDGDLVPISQTSSSIVLRNPNNGVLTTVTGTGLSINPTTGAASGVVTGWVTRAPGETPAVTVTGVLWNLSDMTAALQALNGSANDSLVLALLSRQAITLDASGMTERFIARMPDGITSAVTFIGSDFRDDMRGSNGNDRFNLDGAPSNDGSYVFGSRGNDTIDMSGLAANSGWSELVYHQSPASSVALSIVGTLNTAQVVKNGVGIDTIQDVFRGMNSEGGMSVWGTDGNDSFNILTGPQQWYVGLRPGRGVDSYTLNLNADTTVRIDFRRNWFDNTDPTQGLQVNLATGIIANDGFGNAETITRIGDGRVSIFGTPNADTMIGGDGRDEFFPGGGNDTIDGGGGTDRIRFDRVDMTSGVTVDMATGTATGQWRGADFTVRFANIEQIRGTIEANDTLRGSSGNDLIDARGGNNLIEGRDGNDTLFGAALGESRDTLFGGDGNDSISGLAGNDELHDGAGNDSVRGDAGDDTFMSGTGQDTFDGGEGFDMLVLDVSSFAPGAFVVETDLAAGISGARGTMNGRDSLISIEGVQLLGSVDAHLSGNSEGNRLDAGDGNDTLEGRDGNDSLDGGGGNDLLSDGAGQDVMRGGVGADTFAMAADGQRDTILDFDPLQDVIDLTAWAGLTSLSQLTLTSTEDGIDIAFGTEVLTVETEFGTTIAASQLNRTNLRLTASAEDPEPGPGDTTGGAGADPITGTAEAEAIFGLEGNDTLRGGDGDDTLYGGPGADRLDGEGGNNVLRGGLGNDRYILREGDVIEGEIGFSQGGGIDTVEAWISYTLPRNVEILRLQGDADIDGFGNAAPEALVGNTGRNTLEGGGGNDVLNGKAGDDTLVGGTGADSLVGEDGADTFVIRAVSESRPGQANRDFINGFFRAEGDRIDLSLIDANSGTAGDDAFTFIGSAAFSGVAGQLRFFTFGGGNFNIVEADVNGDRVADMQIFVNLTNSMQESDFIL